MTRTRKRSGSFPTIPPGHRMVVEVMRITIEPELQSGISHPVPFVDGLAKCETYDIDDDDRDEPTQRWLRKTGT